MKYRMGSRGVSIETCLGGTERCVGEGDTRDLLVPYTRRFGLELLKEIVGTCRSAVSEVSDYG